MLFVWKINRVLIILNMTFISEESAGHEVR